MKNSKKPNPTNLTTEVTILDDFCKKMKKLEDINHMMAHNLRGAASNIKMLSEILLDRESEPGNEKYDNGELLSLHEALVCINKSSTSLINTLGTLMDEVSNRLKANEVHSDCKLDEIIDNIVLQMNGTIMQKQAKIKQHLTVKQVQYTRVHLESLFYNLISNSLKYARPNVPPVIDIISKLDNGRPSITVKDNGMGIDLDKYGDRLFGLNQVFHEGHDSNGIGLYMTKQQIESKGGKIIVESYVNMGTSFTIVL